MTDFLLKIFVKDYKNVDDAAVRKKCGTLASVVGIAVNFLLAAIKLLAGILSASVAIIADAVNNMSDAGSQVHFNAMRKIAAEHPSEVVGNEIRKLYSWADEEKFINN